MLKIVLLPLMITLLVACSPDSEPGSGLELETESAAIEKEQDQNQPVDVNEPIDEGKAWLAENARKEGVVVTESGLQYLIIQSGVGVSPGPGDKVVTHYVGSFIDGKVFDSSIERGQPAEFPVKGVIKAWTEALQLMKEGDKWQLFVPPELGYGERGTGPIPGNTVLVFEVELIEVKAG